MKKNIKIKDLDCAACAAELQEELETIEGISEAAVDFINQRVSLDYQSQVAFEKAIDTISHFEEVKIIDGNAPVKKERHLKELLSIVVSAVLFVPALVLSLVFKTEEGLAFWGEIAKGDAVSIATFALFLTSALAAGWSVLVTVAKNFVKLFREFHLSLLFDENFLMFVAAVGAFAVGQNMEGAAVMLLYQIGEYLQSLAVGSSRNSIAKLMEMRSESAILLDGDEQKEVAPEELNVGDLILLRKGDKVPVDCVLMEGETALDTKSLTGEAYLREVKAGDEMLAGCVNCGNAVKARAVRTCEESAVAKILDMVENSTAQKAQPEKFITKFARIYTPVVVLIALVVAVVPPLFQSFDFVPWILTALNFLVISCPCALIISVPLTYFSGIGALARQGVLAKGATYLDTLAGVKVAVFDKTGTLTEGKFSVAEFTDERALQLAAAVEKTSSHPLAEAFKGIETPYVAEQSEEIAGMGLRAVVNGKTVLVGSARLMQTYGVTIGEVASAHVVIYVAEEGKEIGSIQIEDCVRKEAYEALTGLKEAGVQKLAVLSGDGKERVEASLSHLPLDEIHAELLPEQKPLCAQELKKNGILMYVGDGINDTPVMAESDLAVAMGALGSDAAIEASDLVLTGDALTALPKAYQTAKKTKRIVFQNIIGSIAIKLVLMVLSLFGWIPLWAAVFGDVGVMLLAVLNSMRMRKKAK